MSDARSDATSGSMPSERAFGFDDRRQPAPMTASTWRVTPPEAQPSLRARFETVFGGLALGRHIDALDGQRLVTMVESLHRVGVGICVTRRAESGDEQLRCPHLAGRAVDHVQRRAGVIDEQPLAGDVVLPHGRR
jgi:hypothetical protein